MLTKRAIKRLPEHLREVAETDRSTESMRKWERWDRDTEVEKSVRFFRENPHSLKGVVIADSLMGGLV